MRFSLRKTVQVVLILFFLVMLNLFYAAFVQEWPDSDKVVNDRSFGQYQNGGNVHYGGAPNHQLPKGNKPHSRQERSIKDYNGDKFGDGFAGIIRNSSPRLPSTTNVYQRQTQLRDIFISVKTTKSYHSVRLDLLLDTWFLMARDDTYFFTDAEDPVYQKKTRGHLINTNCSSVHSRRALCCKMAVEYDTYMATNKRWFCHVDDDTYVNVPRLLKTLQQYNHSEDWYLGKPSLNHPIELRDVESPTQKIAFWFATGGAGFCISRGLALKMMPFTGGGKLMAMGEKIRLPDDCTIGYIVYHKVKKELTVIDGFHSHLEGLWQIRAHQLNQHITFSYSQYRDRMNVVDVGGLDMKDDPTRFRSIHCILYPYTKGCPTQRRLMR